MFIINSKGLGTDGQLGHGNGNDYTIPEKVKFFDKMFVKKISAGHSTSAAITGSLNIIQLIKYF